MNTHADKRQENKSQSVANTVSQEQSGGESTLQFVDNRPEAIAQRKLQEMADNSQRVKQLKAIEEMANNSPRAKQAAQLQAMTSNYSSKGGVIQRYLDIKGAGVFDMNNFDDFQERYSQANVDNMLNNIQQVGGGRYHSIQDALGSPDVCMIYYDNDDDEYYPEFVENERKLVPGGATRHVLGHASYVARPPAGFEELQMSGLNNCVAVAVETIDGTGVSGIAVSHFTTPLGIDPATKTLTDHGKLALNGFHLLVPGGTAHILWNDQSPETRSDATYTSGQEAANIVAFYLHSIGIKTVDIDPLTADSCQYRLSHDGTAGWHG